MRHLLVLASFTAVALSACGNWPADTTIYNPPTPIPSRTPVVRTATPVILTPSPFAPVSETPTLTATLATSTATMLEPTGTFTPMPTASLTPDPTPTPGALKADVLGCDTSIDITHGMGEVTNAYVTISNSTMSDINDLCATLSALDEGRAHPDKTKCIPSLPASYQVTLKLTVDSTFKQQTPVQIDVNSGTNLLLRVGEPACTDIGLLQPDSEELGVPEPMAPPP